LKLFDIIPLAAWLASCPLLVAVSGLSDSSVRVSLGLSKPYMNAFETIRAKLAAKLVFENSGWKSRRTTLRAASMLRQRQSTVEPRNENPARSAF
jgi:hypothetical protein